MKSPHTLFAIAVISCVAFLAACDGSPTATPTAAPTTVPTAVPQPTQAPSATALPPSPTAAPTNTRPAPTNTVIPTSPTPTVTNTLPPVTAQPTVPTATATATEVVLKYSAPVLIEPTSGDSRTTSNDMLLRWQPVAALGSNECYLVTIRITNTVDSQYGEQSFLAQNTCNDAGTGPVSFTISKKPPAPNYDGLVSVATTQTPANSFLVTWNVIVVQDNGMDPNKPDPALYVPLSPPSETFEFSLEG